MFVHSRDDIYLDKLISERFSASFMSNSKWVKLITTLVENASIVTECLVKPIWDDEKLSRRLLIDGEKQYQHDFYDSAMEGMVSGKPIGWYAYKEIEWLEFPSNGTHSHQKATITQDIKLIRRIIERVGQFKIDFTDANLRLYAYCR